MSLRRQVLRRTALIGVGSSAVATVAALAFAIFAIHGALDLYLPAVIGSVPSESDFATCEEGGAWQRQIRDEVRVLMVPPGQEEALVGPYAPALQRALAQTSAGGVQVVIHPQHGGGFVWTRARPGRCGVVVATWSLVFGRRLSIVISTFLVVMLATLVATFTLGFPMASRLVRRIERLGTAAAGVGSDYQSAEDAGSDELANVGRALDRAHARILEQQAQLEHEKLALQRHMADIAHDLKTPLTALRLLVEQAHAGDDPDSALVTASEQVSWLALLVDSLRTQAQLREGLFDAAKTQQVDLREVVERVGLRAKILAKQRGIELFWAEPGAPVDVWCHPLLVEQAVSNLVHNAIAHGAGAKNIAVVLDRRPRRGRRR